MTRGYGMRMVALGSAGWQGERHELTSNTAYGMAGNCLAWHGCMYGGDFLSEFMVRDGMDWRGTGMYGVWFSVLNMGLVIN